MDPSAWRINADTSEASMEIPGLAAHTGGVTLRMKARVVIRTLQPDQDIEPQLISHFCRRTVSSSDHVTAEDAHFTSPWPYRDISHHPTWEEQTQRMLSYVAANHVLPADLDLLAMGFRSYTDAVHRRFPITSLVAVMEFFSVVEIPVTPSASASQLLYYTMPPEAFEYFYGDDGDINVEVAQHSRGPRPASTAAVEGLRMVTRTEEDNSCSICLEVMTQALAMPCGHSFHEGCLKEWLRRRYSCLLCRFSLPAAQ